MFSRLLAVLLISLALVSCGNRSDLMTTKDRTPAANSAMLNSMMVGNVTGGSNALDFAGVSDNEFKDALAKSLAAKSLLAANPGTARYRVDAAIDFNSNRGFSGATVSGTATYTITSVADNRQVYNNTIPSSSMKTVNDFMVASSQVMHAQGIGDKNQAFVEATSSNLTIFVQSIGASTLQ
jgi:hypothetical protein